MVKCKATSSKFMTLFMCNRIEFDENPHQNLHTNYSVLFIKLLLLFLLHQILHFFSFFSKNPCRQDQFPFLISHQTWTSSSSQQFGRLVVVLFPLLLYCIYMAQRQAMTFPSSPSSDFSLILLFVCIHIIVNN